MLIVKLILQIAMLAALFFYIGVALKYELQMMQQNTYRNKRYWNWMKNNGDSASPRRLTLYFFTLAACTRFTPEVIYPIIKHEVAKQGVTAVLLDNGTEDFIQLYDVYKIVSEFCSFLFCFTFFSGLIFFFILPVTGFFSAIYHSPTFTEILYV